ncbi:MAG: DNA replication and repair protein RecF [Saprospiraceae bacterium]|nr:DNA replication and repair protein RecF [Saprospiraceae bacterium]
MFISSIVLTNFKSYQSASFSFSPSLNIIHGLNGMGKTNLLDAIYCVAMTKSYFGTSDRQMIHDGQAFFRLESKLLKGDEELSLIVKYQQGGKKTIQKNGNAYDKLSEHIGVVPVVMIAPNDLVLIDGLNADRRKFVDSTISQINHSYLNHLVLYHRLLKQRNALLKRFQEEGNFDPILLKTYDLKMEMPAQYLYKVRQQFFMEFTEKVQQQYATLSQRRESVDIRYVSSLEKGDFLQLMQDALQHDRYAGRTNVGPHKDKIECKLEGRMAKTFGSQGQKKSLVFAIKLAQYEVIRKSMSVKPLLLLDDLFDKLDHRRVDQLLSIILKGNFGQVFVTDTQLDRLEPLLMDLTGDYVEIKIDDLHVE